MIILARLKGAGAVNFRARYLASHRRSQPYDPLSTLARGGGSLPRSVHPKVAERLDDVPPPQRLSRYSLVEKKAYKVRMGAGSVLPPPQPSPALRAREGA